MDKFIIIQGIGIAIKTCVVFNIIVKKIKPKHPNLLTNFDLTSKADVFAVSIETYRFLMLTRI
jgi:hypothetical protein